ncbi:MAG: hypothetical protein IIC35_00010 [Gemmatimonadetes bacterium]|nr:hypothetical protein [Gemmatimonadota bacterium]
MRPHLAFVSVAIAFLGQPALGVSAIAQPVGGDRSATAEGQQYPVDPLSIPRPTMRAVRIYERLDIDGSLDDAAWARTRPSEEVWIQTLPDAGMPASEHTTIRVLYDDENLYIGAVMYDSDPYNLIVPGLEQDFDTPNSDMFAFGLDTYHDRRNGFVFVVNPAGAVFDAQAFNDQRDLSTAWRASWTFGLR